MLRSRRDFESSRSDGIGFDSFQHKKPRFDSHGALSGLLSSLLAQGVISLTKEFDKKDSAVPTDFGDVTKIRTVRHESVIRALYADMPRQCASCGVRFKSQEDHGKHMDWHVIKNRTAKKKKRPCRNWFASDTQERVSNFFQTERARVEDKKKKKEEEEDGQKDLVVPADENQTVCALCGDPLEDFYSHDAEDWMYKGAVYLDPNGSTPGKIVHANCRP